MDVNVHELELKGEFKFTVTALERRAEAILFKWQPRPLCIHSIGSKEVDEQTFRQKSLWHLNLPESGQRERHIFCALR